MIHEKQIQSRLLDFSNIALQNFVNSLRTEKTKSIYLNSLKNYLIDNNLTLETLLKLSVKDSERLLINYIEKLKREGKSRSFINLVFCSLKHLYIMKNIRINKEKIGKFLGESVRKKTDRAYTHEEIKKILDVADLRTKSIVLLMASTGMRIGAIPDLKLKHLKEISKEKIYKIKVYEKSKEEYYTFCSPECYSVLNLYLDYRKNSGEKVDGESHLIREQFDINDFEQIRKKSRKVSLSTIKNIIIMLLRKAGLRELDHNYQSGNREIIPMSHGFRKFWMTQAVKSKMNPEARREMLLGHKIGLASAYYRPSEDEMLDSYLVAVDNLTINEENRLRRKVEVLTIEKSKVDMALAQIEEMKKQIGL